jgi:pimeloyl-ACP methyl ester carboxylesterase
MRHCALVAVLYSTLLSTAAPAATNELARARATIAATQALPPGAIDEEKSLDIGGIKQWITVRGSDKGNPILLFLHGGPGTPMMPESWTFQRPWEDYFTVVQWDQRGAGKTFSAAYAKTGKPLSVELMTGDTIELIQYLQRTYGKRKIFLMGHSWGSVLGMEVARRRPDLLFAYIGVGQVIDMRRNEELGYSLTLAEARRRNNAKAVAQLEAIAPYPNADRSIPLQKTAVERAWAVALRGMMYAQTDGDDGTRRLSPAYTARDVDAAARGEMFSVTSLWPELSRTSFADVRTLDCPLILFAGEHDMVTPPELVRSFFDQVQAPLKRFFLVPNAAHYVVNEAPGVTLVDLVTAVLPLAGGAGAPYHAKSGPDDSHAPPPWPSPGTAAPGTLRR